MPEITMENHFECPSCLNITLPSKSRVSCCEHCAMVIENGIRIIGEYSNGEIIYHNKKKEKEEEEPKTQQEAQLRKYIAVMDLEQKALVLEFIEKNIRLS